MMPKERPMTGSSRQRPVSCRFCRTRKLRCSREAPCTNCTSRGIECELKATAQPPADATEPSKTELLERIQTLESLLQNAASDGRSVAYASPSQSDCCSAEARQESQNRRDADGINSDVAWLSRIYNGTKRAPDELPPDKVVFRICAIKDVLANSRLNFMEPPSAPGAWPRKVFWLPQHAEAASLIDKYWRHVEHVHHVVYEPHLRSLADRIYSRLTKAEHIKSGEMVLLLAIFASAIRSWTEKDCQDEVMFSSRTEAHTQADFWMKEAESLLDLARRTTLVSIEGVQAAVILMFVPADLDGFWRRCRGLHSTAIFLSRELGLHGIDLPSNAHCANTVKAEIGRRVWWHIVASDWAVAPKIDDIPRGFYQTRVGQMMTNRPLNLDDKDLQDGVNRVGKPISEPTDMSYGLFRIRMGDICRHLTDRTPFAAFNSTGPSFDTVMDIDAEMLTLFHEMPPFFSMSSADLISTYHMDSVKAEGVVRQGHVLRSLLNGARCKLHLPYLARGYNDPEFAPSRVACIDSARHIIQGEKDFAEANPCAGMRHRPLGLLMAVFVACIVLLMDLCHSKGSPHHLRQRLNIANAFRLLEELKTESKMADDLITSMMQILYKHHISPPGVTPDCTQDIENLSKAGCLQPLCKSTVACRPDGIPTPEYHDHTMATTPDITSRTASDACRDELPYFPNLAQSVDQGMTIDNINWGDLFLDLESTFS